MTRYLAVVLTLVLALPASADGLRRWSRLPKLKCGSPHYCGDPVLASVPEAATVRQTSDVRLSLPRGSFEFIRTWVSDPASRGQVTPTAGGEAACRTSVLQGSHLPFADARLAHSLLSRVHDGCSAYTRVLTPDGDLRFFGPLPWGTITPGSALWVPRAAEALSEPARLLFKWASGGGFSAELYMEDGRVFVYAVSNAGFRLTSATGADARKQYDVIYADLSSAIQPGLSGAACSGLTEPVEVRFPETALVLKLQYFTPQVGATIGTQCLLGRVAVWSPAGTQPLVTYEYDLSSTAVGTYRGTLQIEDGGVAGLRQEWTEQGGYTTARYELVRPQVLRPVVDTRDDPGSNTIVEVQSKHDLGTGTAVQSSTEGWTGGAMRRDFFPMQALGSTGASACFSPDINSRQLTLQAGGLTKSTTLSFFVGDSGLPDGGWTADLGYDFGPVPSQIFDSCGGSPGCAEGTVEFRYGAATVGVNPGSPLLCGGPGTPTVLWATKGRDNAFTVAPPTYDTQKGGTFRTATVKLGATDSAGTGALSEQTRAFAFFGDVQLLTSVSEPSVLSAGAQATTSYQRNSSGAVVAVVRSGYKRSPFSGAVDSQPTHIALFMRQGPRPCSLLSDGAASTRTSAIEGPCEVASPTATSCNSSSRLVTELYYYDQPLVTPRTVSETAATAFNSGRLALARSYPNGCFGNALDTEFASYTPEGMAAKVADANGVWRTLDIHVRYPSRVSGPDGEYVLEWEMGHLRQVREPSGALWVACYPGYSGYSYFPICSRASSGLAGKPAWIGRFAGGGTTYLRALGTPLEHYRFTYSPDETISKVELVDVYNDTLLPEQQKVLWSREISTDAERRVSWERIGVGSWFVANRYDTMHNLVASAAGFDLANPGLPSSVPQYCQDAQGSVSGLCAQFQFDRLNRLTASRRPATTSAGADCLSYDAQGNLSRVERGCGASSCSNNYATGLASDGQGNLLVSGAPNCSSAPIDYVWDDFGRLTSLRLGPQGETRLGYDAIGNLVTRVTPKQRAVSALTQVESDSLGRLIRVLDSSGATMTALFARQYDAAPALPASCAGKVALGNLKGRLAYESAPVWNTWFGYDEAGRLTAELRVAPGGSCAATENASWSFTQYAYWPDGRLQYVKYPFGRGVYYQYPAGSDPRDPRLPISISMDVYSSPTVTSVVPIIDNITWRRDGQLASYRLRHFSSRPASGTAPSFLTTVTRDYGSSDDLGASLMETIPSSCGASIGSSTRADGTGRLRRIRAANSSGASIFDQWYTWRADEVVSIDRCYPGQTTPLNELRAFDASGGRGYDGASRLRFSTLALAGGAVAESSREFRYDDRGNRSVIAFAQVPASGDVEGQRATLNGDGMTRLSPVRVNSAGTTNLNGTRSLRDFTLDENGRVVSEMSSVDTSGGPNQTITFTFPYGGGAERGGVDSVIRAVNVNGLVFNYYYDSRNHRTRKQYPNGAVEDFVYEPSGHLLSERSFTESTNSTGNTVDEYIWLGNTPVAMVRTLFDGNMVRAPDWSGTTVNGQVVCRRRAEDARCATHFFVNDLQGKPVMGLDKDALVAGVGEYDAFGAMNRVVSRVETAHPYSKNQDYTLVSQVGRDKLALTLPMRARFSFVDTNANYTCGQLLCSDADRAEVLADRQIKATVKGQRAGPITTGWFTTTNGRFDVRWTTDGAGTLRDGVVFAGYDYQRIGTGAFRAFPPLRFPGQYFDEETGLHENWNRYYDPTTGRYLSPEPLLQSPTYVRRMAQTGMSVPTYAYAANNPLRYVDKNGLYFTVNASNPNAVWSALQRLAANPQFGWAIEKMAADPRINFELNERPYDACTSTGGGRANRPEETARRGEYLSAVDYNLDATNAVFHVQYPGAPYDRSFTLDRLLAHELGHEFSFNYFDPAAPDDSTYALDWDNSTRGPGPYRLDHAQGGQCRQVCGP